MDPGKTFELRHTQNRALVLFFSKKKCENRIFSTGGENTVEIPGSPLPWTGRVVGPMRTLTPDPGYPPVIRRVDVRVRHHHRPPQRLHPLDVRQHGAVEERLVGWQATP